ncbi:MAG: hypothetical protein ACYC9U_02325 [Nitrososphaerales archaeon]
MKRSFLLGTVLSSILVLALLGTLVPVTFAASQTRSDVKAGIVSPFAGKWSDSFGNSYHFKGQSNTASSYKIKGALTSSSYLLNTPWKIKGSGSGSSFTFKVIDAVRSNGDCTFVVSGTISGSLGSQTASGTWQNVGSSSCTSTGSITLTQTAANPVITFTGGMPGLPS